VAAVPLIASTTSERLETIVEDEELAECVQYYHNSNSNNTNDITTTTRQTFVKAHLLNWGAGCHCVTVSGGWGIM